jgi:hypothetical protein
MSKRARPVRPSQQHEIVPVDDLRGGSVNARASQQSDDGGAVAIKQIFNRRVGNMFPMPAGSPNSIAGG